jgi:hypothetical protein
MSQFTKLTGLASGLIAGLGLCGIASAQAVTISEIFINPPGSDQGQEALEIRGPAGASLAGYWFLTIDGDGTAAGVIDQRVDLGSFTLGSNGLLLIRDDAAVLSPAPAAETTVAVLDFSPDIENGSNTYVLAKFAAPPPASGTDIDTDDDGVIDAGALTGLSDVDAVSVNENTDPIEIEYGADPVLGGTALGPLPDPKAKSTFTPDVLYRIYSPNGDPCIWAAADVLGTTPGPYTVDALEYVGFDEAGVPLGDPVTLSANPGTLNEVSADEDGNGIGDPCEDGGKTPACPADLDGNGVVNGFDLALLLGSWGPCAGCLADLDDNDIVNGFDLALLLGAWGPCPTG